MGSNPTVTAIVMSRDIVPDRTHKITIFVGSFIYRRLPKDAKTIRDPMISDTQCGHWFSRPGGKTLCRVQEGAKWLSFVLKRQIALFKKHSEKPGNYVLNIEQFAEPTLLRAKRVEVGTISRFIREQCLDSGGNYVLAYDTTVTAIVNVSGHSGHPDPRTHEFREFFHLLGAVERRSNNLRSHDLRRAMLPLVLKAWRENTLYYPRGL